MKNSSTLAASWVNRVRGRLAKNFRPYVLVTSLESSTAKSPWSVPARISRPRPCLSVMIASGIW
ncbi:MAG: hypothetical protein SV487_09335 [Thermodesulfobacteriota bacterium]|nr:hypothetical protein [Thermodesulfobacteriota bacterium]